MRTCLLCEATSAGTAVVFRAKRIICTWCEDELAKTGRRFCTVCCAVKPASLFCTAYKKRNRCRACENAGARARYRANPIPARARAARWRKEHPERSHARKRAWLATPHGRARARLWDRAWKRRHPARRREVNQAYRARNRGQVLAAGRARWQRYYIRRKLAILRGER